MTDQLERLVLRENVNATQVGIQAVRKRDIDLPAMVLFAVMMAWPILRSLYLSFFEYYFLEPEATCFVGFGNYARLLSEPVNHLPFWNTLRFALIFVPPYVGLALIVAVMLHGVRRGSGFLRTMIFMPMVVSMAVSAVMWTLFYNST